MSSVEIEYEADRELRSAEVKVWDIAVRIFHWSLVVWFVLAWISADEWDSFHEISGYVVAGLIGFRLLWGLIGSRHARFSDFVVRPSTLIVYLRDSFLNRAKRYLGHNPAGGAMILVLLGSLVVATVSGIVSTSNAFWGVEWVEDLHEVSASIVLVLVLFHLAGVVYSSLAHRENLVKSMFTGKKRSL